MDLGAQDQAFPKVRISAVVQAAASSIASAKARLAKEAPTRLTASLARWGLVAPSSWAAPRMFTMGQRHNVVLCRGCSFAHLIRTAIKRGLLIATSATLATKQCFLSCANCRKQHIAKGRACEVVMTVEVMRRAEERVSITLAATS